MKNRLVLFLLILLLYAGFGAAVRAQNPAFAKGADVGWLTEMEAAGRQFYNSAGTPQDLLQILDDYDMNTIRLRVWVNPAGGWNGKNDVVAKAIRARNRGFRLLIDFHYSDSWADPGQQAKPAAWRNLGFADLKTALYNHTYDVLDSLKDNGIVPEWVQVGNETNDGMLWPDGRRTTNPQNFAALIDQGYAAVKAVNPTSKVIVHISNGFNSSLFRSVFDGLTTHGARYDVIGMSLYPTTTDWPLLTAQCQANMNDLVTRYPGKEVMLVETGMPADAPIPARQMLLDLMSKVRAVPGNKGLGVLYWEPQAYNWQGYSLSAWSNTGRPTAAMDAFRDTPPSDGLVYNPSFEYTAVTQTPVGWSTAGPNATANFTQSYGRTSPLQLVHYQATAYQVRTYQLLTAVPNGTYTLRAWVQSSGGQKLCQLYASGFGGAERTAAIVGTSGTWQQLQVPGVVVTNGQCEIGLRSDANANDFCSLDDVEFVPNAVTAVGQTAAANGLDARIFPNPVSQQCTISYTLAQPETVQLDLYSLTGQHLRTLQPARRMASGTHRQAVELGSAVASGVYLLSISHGGQHTVQRLIKY
ncbi:glycosyl hydrolase 53 family protein [Hymenobacter cellulosilyticus]|uniref:Arabinogalactan endo-beta-1,4-galactanase n=1 Tax=Hymenobacter cellulosilyticus TaxID=2932248 RepID=A0A8T9QAK4_9BACT|nr:glycosyl hydrolase 53 family protein [Hymenobacter cellulosilyticus]UOQ73168.1 glycosyl hydrolase 53 family protein [Hymenobacter cellulosilyticus]